MAIERVRSSILWYQISPNIGSELSDTSAGWQTPEFECHEMEYVKVEGRGERREQKRRDRN
jgi:hypothetical protein